MLRCTLQMVNCERSQISPNVADARRARKGKPEMAEDSKSLTGLVERAKSAVSERVNPAMIGGFSVVGHWFADKGNPSYLVLQSGGEGTEVFEADGKDVSVDVNWWMKGDYLIITCHAADRDYEHWIVPGTYQRGGLQGESDSGEIFRFYPLR